MNPLDITRELKSNPYPGRGIILGRSDDNTHAVIAYWIMGRSENSRNRIFVETEDGIKTQAFDSSKVSDPTLIIYHPVRTFGKRTIVTNGDQTDTIRDAYKEGHCYRHALRQRTFEPDGPNYTPRISGVMEENGDYCLSILKTRHGDPVGCHRYFFEYTTPAAGEGHYLSTYQSDGDPLPSYEGEPKRIAISGSIDVFAAQLWESLNTDNKVSLFVRYINLSNGQTLSRIFNKYE